MIFLGITLKLSEGQKELRPSEKSLREFFIREPFSPFELKKYKEILDDLLKIINILEFIDIQTTNQNEITKWLQLIELYTNQYPKFAVVTYFFINNLDIDNNLEDFLVSLVRYIYYQGSTTRVKFEIYTIIKQISLNQRVNDYYVDVDISFFNQLGRLKYGFALLGFYMEKNKPLSNYHIDKLISLRDENQLPEDWPNIDINEIIDSLGNFIVIETPKKNIPFSKKIEFYKNSQLYEKEPFFIQLTYKSFKDRDL